MLNEDHINNMSEQSVSGASDSSNNLDKVLVVQVTAVTT
jgi:hypothetical protein